MWEYNTNVQVNELYHHGILGMHWGIRRFQQKDGSLTRAGRERYGSKDAREKMEAKAAKKEKKLSKKQEKLQKKQEMIEQERIKRLEDQAKLKEEILSNGTPEQVLRNKDMFTNAELNYLITRFGYEESLRKMSPRELTATESFVKSAEEVSSRLNATKDVLTKGADLYNQIAKVHNAMQPDDGKEWGLIGEKKDKTNAVKAQTEALNNQTALLEAKAKNAYAKEHNGDTSGYGKDPKKESEALQEQINILKNKHELEKIRGGNYGDAESEIERMKRANAEYTIRKTYESNQKEMADKYRAEQEAKEEAAKKQADLYTEYLSFVNAGKSESNTSSESKSESKTEASKSKSESKNESGFKYEDTPKGLDTFYTPAVRESKVPAKYNYNGFEEVIPTTTYHEVTSSSYDDFTKKYLR